MNRFLVIFAVLALSAGCDNPPPSVDAGPLSDAGPRVDTGPRLDAGPDSGGGGGCTDEDSDGYGEGCALGADCDDSMAAVNPGATEVCDGINNDCDAETDEALETPSCALSDGVCAGATARCGADGFLECDAADYGATYEADESLCDGLDNDCDGSTDEGCSCENGQTQACGSDVGMCTPGSQTCVNMLWGPCEGDIGPMGEACDGVDNDCDSMTDEPSDLTPPDCPLQQGVCAGSKRECGGVAGWIACSGVQSYGGDYEPVEALCDSLDNDCDGITDEGCDCVTGTTQACGTDRGECSMGTQTCTVGAWGGCAGETQPLDETCNAADDDCDGSTDEDVVAPACALTMGVCAGATQPCGGAGGFEACAAGDYGASYETDETSCDGNDNDCDGTTDEGCTCVTGAMQECGLSIGACERGTQTCVAGEWSDCTGGVGPETETCNGADDDCNGPSDDGLTAPACTLSEGVCAGSTQVCGGMSGFEACAGTDSYGPNFVATEDGGADESLCDGLDNDCNGVVDDGCISGPLFDTPQDTIGPAIYGRHMVYSANFDGNWDIVYRHLDQGTERRLTTTPENELLAEMNGNRVVFIRDQGLATARAVLYDLSTDTETVLASGPTLNVDIAGQWAVWDEDDGTSSHIFMRDLTTGTTANVFPTSTANEGAPSIRGGQVAYISDESGDILTRVVDISAGVGTPVEQVPTGSPMSGHAIPLMGFSAITWTDGRSFAPPGELTSDWDLYGAQVAPGGTGFLSFPSENAIETSIGAQLARGLDSTILVWDDFRGDNWDVGVTLVGSGTTQLITFSDATQADGVVSGNHIVWTDNRLGDFDIYQAFFVGATFAPDVGDVQLFEVLADPPAAVDVNGDGAPDTTDDEFVELVNTTGLPLDISGFTLSDATGVRHTFPVGTTLPALGLVVVFGGGTPSGPFGGAIVQTASGGQLGLNNDGDTITLRAADNTEHDALTYGSEGGMDESVVRDTGGTVRHSTVTGAVGPFSPGLFVDQLTP